MSVIQFIKAEVAAAFARGIRQCVIIGSEAHLREALTSAADRCFRLYAVDREVPADLPATVVQTRWASEPLAAVLARSDFDKLKASLFVWLGDARFHTADAVMASLLFIASMPGGSGVVLDYAVERPAFETLPPTALDALASRISAGDDPVRHLIEPQAVSAMLRGIGFQSIVDLTYEELPQIGGHLVSALV